MKVQQINNKWKAGPFSRPTNTIETQTTTNNGDHNKPIATGKDQTHTAPKIAPNTKVDQPERQRHTQHQSAATNHQSKSTSTETRRTAPVHYNQHHNRLTTAAQTQTAPKHHNQY